GEAAARPAGAEVPPAWWAERAVGRRPGHRGDERRPAGGGEASEAAGRLVLPAERVLVSPAAAARAQGGSATAHAGVHQRIQSTESEIDRRRRSTNHADDRALCVAGKRARAPERDRARHHPRPWSIHRAEAPAAVPRGGAGAAASASGGARAGHYGR